MHNTNRLKAGYIYSDIIDKRLDNITAEDDAVLQKAYIANSELHFENSRGFDIAMKEGIFMLKIPDYLSLTPCDNFAQNFYKGFSESEDSLDDEFKLYKKFRGYTSENFNDPLLGFHERVDQIEQFLLEKRFWNTWYPGNNKRC